ncbi:hypothetical protein BH695_3626 [Microcystis aeruginosa PCC 7806SL]|uniref:Uncharacterized protein n=1 Tax=Microcystis aeruginosa PCC 7806SL TaxID=1903187 RepID=A0AB33BRS3_MICA7|nr:hypothetical protein BH695_3626 [Microcystis aeruginosa PCC 7806SL]
MKASADFSNSMVKFFRCFQQEKTQEVLFSWLLSRQFCLFSSGD